MKLLLFSDVHCSARHCEQIVTLSKKADVIIGAGDLATVRRGLAGVINILKSIDKPTVLVPGNSETDAELKQACQDWPSAVVLHGSGTEIEGIPFFGIGGGIPITPFGSWSFDFSEEEAAKLLTDCPPNCILVSHSPPKGAVDISSSGHSLGSVAIGKAISQLNPKLVVCGHIHASAGKHEMIGTTPVVNAGPEGMFWEIGD